MAETRALENCGVWISEPQARGSLHLVSDGNKLRTDLGGSCWAGEEIQNKETDLRDPWKKVECQDMWACGGGEEEAGCLKHRPWGAGLQRGRFYKFLIIFIWSFPLAA